MSGLADLGELWNSIQHWLLPDLEDELGDLDAKHQQFITTCETVRPEDFMAPYRWVGVGGHPHDRLALCKAFIAKAVWDFPTTRDLLDAVAHRPALRRLCGWETRGEVPSESTFSRAFAAFAQDELPQRIHAALFPEHYGDKLAGHVSRDSTAIAAREQAATKKPREAPVPKRRGRRPKDAPAPPPDPRRLQLQLTRSLEANLADLPRACDWGGKTNSQGKYEYWRGYKLHVDVIDGDLPVSFILSSASLHDSQAAIPLAQLTAARVTSLYDLADAAYDAKEIREFSARLGHVAIIDHNPRRGEKRHFAPAAAARYHQRASVERVHSHLFDEHGGNHLRVRGAVKIAAHLAFGLLVIAAEQLLKLLT